MSKRIKQIVFLGSILVLFTGCSILNLGEPQGYCDEHGCDFSDAGVCGDVFETYKTRYKDLDRSYRHLGE
ncbi:MAG: hypothetical protein AB7E13_07340 [Arcobacteraceae bacterium]